MRVISGTCRGRRLKSLDGITTRPTTDKVKESLFNIIGPYFDGGAVLDLFAGSGALGIEALSRGVSYATFIEKDARAVRVIEENLRACRLEAQAEVLRTDVLLGIQQLAGCEKRFDTVFIDPPYRIANQLPKWLNALQESGILTEDCWLICEHGTDTELPGKYAGFSQFRQEKYGSTCLSFYRLGG